MSYIYLFTTYCIFFYNTLNLIENNTRHSYATKLHAKPKQLLNTLDIQLYTIEEVYIRVCHQVGYPNVVIV